VCLLQHLVHGALVRAQLDHLLERVEL
jgi:hypothetical protein